MFPPHLPPPTCNVAHHEQWKKIKVVLAATFFGIISGFTGASVFLGWVGPNSAGADSWLVARNVRSPQRSKLESQAENRMADKIFVIYGKSGTVQGASYVGEKVGEGIMAVTSGWLVSYLPQYDGRFKEWSIIGANGTVYKATRVLEDARSGLAYIKIQREMSSEPEQFKVAVFSGVTDSLDDVAVYHNGVWQSSFLLGSTIVFSGDSHLDTAMPLRFSLNSRFKPGEIVIDGEGNVIGFMQTETVFSAAGNVNRALLGVEDKTKIIYSSLGIEGWYSEERPIVWKGERITGFLVSKVLVPKSALHKGDVILEVNGRPATLADMWYTISGEKVRLKILRGGKEVMVEGKVIEI